MVTPQTLHSSLLQNFGFKQFRPNQESIIKAITEGRDVLAIMPTGGGKSLCYQLPAVVMDGTAVVISPLISLMKDQVDAAAAMGIKAATINSSQRDFDRHEVFRMLDRGEIDLLYVSPERFKLDAFTRRLQGMKICLFAIDEAHCISQWGHDFRPDYLGLSEIVKLFPGVPVAAFTATATAQVSEDIVGRLGLRDPFRVRASFNRPNLSYSITPRIDTYDQIYEFVKSHEGQSGIIYRLTRQNTEKTCEMLCANGVNATVYHAGLEDNIRRKNQEEFRQDRIPVIVATIAFGMGIDKPNIRWILHADLPKSIENYYQETGRAGRDGDPAECRLLFSRGDIPKLRYFIDDIEDRDERKRQISALDKMVQYASSVKCRRKSLLAHFGEALDHECEGCDICDETFETADVTIDAQKILSAIARTNQRFGAGHVTDIVWGAKTKEIRAQRHDELKTWGAGSDKPKQYWRQLIDELAAEGYIARTGDQYPVLSITEKGWGVLKGETKASVRRIEPAVKQTKKKDTTIELRTDTQILFDELRKLRTSIAESMGVPAYVVFHDRTLREIARSAPRTPEELREISGIGESKLARFGEKVLSCVKAFIDEHPDYERETSEEPQEPVRTKRIDVITITDTIAETRRLLIEQGMSISEASQERRLAASTIVSHLERIILSGTEIDINRYVGQEQQDILRIFFAKHGFGNVSPAVNKANGKITYEDARLMRAYLQKQKEPVGIE